MISRSTLLHLRIPFSITLMPIFGFALIQKGGGGWLDGILTFVALHLFLFPASNAFNSYYDRDETSIGGLKKPPQVTSELLWVALLFDGLAILMGLLVNWQLALMLFVYGLVSKAYSHDRIRLKRFPVLSLLILMLFQGVFTFQMALVGIHDLNFEAIFTNQTAWLAGSLTSVMLLSFYPLTQVYQHEEDAKRGDQTVSRMLGIRGTFYFAGLFMMLTLIGFAVFLSIYLNILSLILFLIFMMPTGLYFGYWFNKVVRDEQQANFTHTMRLNELGAWGFILFVVAVYLLNYS